MAEPRDFEMERLRALREARIRLGLEKTPEAGKANVVVYSTPTCPYCVMVKRYLDGKKITYRDVNVAENRAEAQRLAQTTGETGVPQININGQWIVGFDRPAIDRALGL